jgi:agmatinase
MRDIPLLLLSSLVIGTYGRDVSFPPTQAVQIPILGTSDFEEPIDIISGSQYRGLTTFANLPYINCVADKDAKYDIAILGAPFDTVSNRILASS